MPVKHLFVTLTLLFSLLFSSFAQVEKNPPIDFPDAALRAKIAEALGKRKNTPITPVDMLGLTILDAPNADIQDLTGLEHARNLKALNLGGEFINFKGFVNSNRVSNFSPLAGLINLETLKLSRLSLTDVSFLKMLTQLTWLELWGNNISDISALSGLTQLRHLELGWNAISDISALSGLIQLEVLSLMNNSILDMSPLVKLNLPGRRGYTGLSIESNPLNYASINTHIPEMRAKGVEVKFDDRIPTTLLKISDIAQQGVVNTALLFPFVVEVVDQKNQAFAGVPVTFTITAGGGHLSTTSTTTDIDGKAQAHLTLGRTVGTTTVSVTAADISQSRQFTATAIFRSSPVSIPDPNLHVKIAETLRKPLNEMLTTEDMLKLTTLTANNANIRDLTGLQYADNLTTLSLNNNSISNVVPLARLTQLTTLDLRNNYISDILPLIGMVQSKGSKELHRLYLQGNPLNDVSIHTHIPILQAAGAEAHFDSVLTQLEPMVRLIYFLPRDRQPQPDINAKMNALIKDVQQFCAEEMEAHGFGRKTFRLETDENGDVIVHHVVGRLTDSYYSEHSLDVWKEIFEGFDVSKNYYLTALDVSSGSLNGGTAVGTASSGGPFNGTALITGPGGSGFTIGVAEHELGHAFGLHHFFSGAAISDENWMCYWGALDVHPAFNPSQDVSDEPATIEMLPPSPASLPNAIRLRFTVTDPNGIHQVQLLAWHDLDYGLVGCKQFDGQPNRTVEFVTTLAPKHKFVNVEVIDIHGFRTLQGFSIDINQLLPPDEVVSIPDINLAAAVRQEIGNSITTHTMLNLIALDVSNRQITDLTGLEHAHNLIVLKLGGEDIEGKGFVNSNTISDLSPLKGLTHLGDLELFNNNITDVSPLAEMTQLGSLDLFNNNITDVSPLAKLTQLRHVSLSNNNITDVSPLAGLTRLENLSLSYNNISDISPLGELTRLSGLYLQGNNISGASPLGGLTWLNALNLSSNNISDISPLAELTRLDFLHLYHNNISDISPLAGLTRLRSLSLEDNNISDVSPLVGLNRNDTLWDGTELRLSKNPLSYTSINTHIPAIQAKGIEVTFDNIAYPALLKVSGDNQVGTVGEALPKPFVAEMMDTHGKPMQDVSVTFVITTGSGKLSATTAITDANGRTQTTLTLGQPSGKHTVRVSASGIQSSVIFTANAIEPLIYWIEKHNGTLHCSTGTTVKNPVPSVQNATSLATDIRGGKLYWTQQTSDNTGKIQRANLDGSNVQLVKKLTSVPRDLAVDTANGKLYLTNAWGKIQRLNFDGSNFQSNLITGLDAPKSVVLDMMRSKLYWAEQISNTTGKIQRANLDGSNVQLVKELTSMPLGLALDTVNGKLYLTNAWGKIQRFNLDGSNFEPNFITGLDSPEGIAVDTAKGKLYWTEMNSIKCGDLSGENVQEVVAGLDRPTSIALTIVPVEPAIAAAPARLSVLPTTTGLLPNYPNPFNPETWIPYQLADPSEVTLTIYGVDGRVVRRLALGHRPVGVYHGKSRAAYWDGRNQQGERVASGIYFYTLSAGDFTATRKLLIRK